MRRSSGKERYEPLEPSTVLARRQARYLAKTRGEGGLRFVADDERDVGNAQRSVLEQRLGMGDALTGQPSIGRVAGRRAEGRAEMKAAEIDEIGQFLKPNVPGKIFANVRGHAFDLPARQTALRTWSDRYRLYRVGSQYLETDKVEKLLDAKMRYRISEADLVIDHGHQREQFGIAEVHAVEQLGLTAITHLIRAGEKSLVPEEDVRHFDEAVRTPNPLMPPWCKRYRACHGGRGHRPAPDCHGGHAFASIFRREDMILQRREIVFEWLVPPPADQTGVARKDLWNDGRRQPPLQATDMNRRIR